MRLVRAFFLFIATCFLSLVTATAPAVAAAAEEVVEASELSEYKVHLESNESRFNLGVYLQVSQFSFEGRSLMGNGLEINATYALKPHLAAVVAVSQAFNSQGGLSVMFTGIRAAGSYALTGNFIRSQNTVVIDGQRSLETRTGSSSLLAAEVGAEQFLFNGTNRVIPATGFSLGGRYDRTIGSFRVSANARYAMLAVSAASSAMMSAGVGVLFNF